MEAPRCKYGEYDCEWQRAEEDKDKSLFTNTKGIWAGSSKQLPVCTKRTSMKDQKKHQIFTFCDESKCGQCIFFKPSKEI